MARPTRESLLEELRTLAAQHGPNVTVFTFRKETGIAPYYIYDRWGNWTNLRRAAGLPVRPHPGPVYSNDELLAEYHRAAVNVDDYPTHAEFNRLSDRCFQTLETRFGTTRDVQHQYRDWLAAQGPEESPKFLEGCPPGYEPTAVPGLNIINGDWLRSVIMGVGLGLVMVFTDAIAAAVRGREIRGQPRAEWFAQAAPGATGEWTCSPVSLRRQQSAQITGGPDQPPMAPLRSPLGNAVTDFCARKSGLYAEEEK